jgi:hypothetical protein
MTAGNHACRAISKIYLRPSVRTGNEQSPLLVALPNLYRYDSRNGCTPDFQENGSVRTTAKSDENRISGSVKSGGMNCRAMDRF